MVLVITPWERGASGASQDRPSLVRGVRQPCASALRQPCASALRQPLGRNSSTARCNYTFSRNRRLERLWERCGHNGRHHHHLPGSASGPGFIADKQWLCIGFRPASRAGRDVEQCVDRVPLAWARWRRARLCCCVLHHRQGLACVGAVVEGRRTGVPLGRRPGVCGAGSGDGREGPPHKHLHFGRG